MEEAKVLSFFEENMTCLEIDKDGKPIPIDKEKEN
jgi:hypothetical protein